MFDFLKSDFSSKIVKRVIRTLSKDIYRIYADSECSSINRKNLEITLFSNYRGSAKLENSEFVSVKICMYEDNSKFEVTSNMHDPDDDIEYYTVKFSDGKGNEYTINCNRKNSILLAYNLRTIWNDISEHCEYNF